MKYKNICQGKGKVYKAVVRISNATWIRNSTTHQNAQRGAGSGKIIDAALLDRSYYIE